MIEIAAGVVLAWLAIKAIKKLAQMPSWGIESLESHRQRGWRV